MSWRVAVAVVAFAGTSLAQSGSPAVARFGARQPQELGGFTHRKPSPANRVEALPPETVHLRPGGTADALLEFRVKPGFHINSNKPGSDLLIPTVVKLDPPTDVSVAALNYPPGHDFTLAIDPSEKLNVYTGDFAVKALVAASRNMPPGRFRVHGYLEYQACDDRACYPPAKLPISFDVRVTRAGFRR